MKDTECHTDVTEAIPLEETPAQGDFTSEGSRRSLTPKRTAGETIVRASDSLLASTVVDDEPVKPAALTTLQAHEKRAQRKRDVRAAASL